MASHEALSAAANDRKARLAQLKSLKRKQAPTTDDQDPESSSNQPSDSTALTRTEDPDSTSTTTKYLSGRNFDPTTRTVKLGFEHTPIADPTQTLEHRASQLALETRKVQAAEKADDKGLDLFKLQPKKPNWDLKRDLEIKMRPLKIKTENAIARLVRERIEKQKAEGLREREERRKKDGSGGDGNGGLGEEEGEEVGMEGSELVEAMRLKEQEEERERRREEEEEEAQDAEGGLEEDGGVKVDVS